MQISVNQQPHIVAQGIKLEQVLAQLDLLRPGIAVALNNEVISNSKWSLINLKADDSLQVFQAIAGG